VNTVYASLLAVTAMLWLASCAPTSETGKITGVETKEVLFKRGHQLYLEQNYDSAAVTLQKAIAIDSSYIPPLEDLAAMHYDLGMREQGAKSPKRLGEFRKSRIYYTRIETLGNKGSDLYERVCELSVALDDNKSFLKYAKRNAEMYPYDRQYLNLGVAYYSADDFANVIKTQKEAIERFKLSSFIGGFYRQLGRAYMKVDRDQTAERTFTIGVQVVDVRIGELRKHNSNYKSSDEYRRLLDDKIGMLVSLKKLHQTYRALDKLEQVEKELKEVGYQK
jgi:tetratricopeptide (TPR) repeat protein